MNSLLRMKEAQDTIKRHRAEPEVMVEKRTAELLKTQEEKERIKEMFGTYVSEEVVAEILESPGGVLPEGHERLERREPSVGVSVSQWGSASIAAKLSLGTSGPKGG